MNKTRHMGQGGAVEVLFRALGFSVFTSVIACGGGSNSGDGPNGAASTDGQGGSASAGAAGFGSTAGSGITGGAAGAAGNGGSSSMGGAAGSSNCGNAGHGSVNANGMEVCAGSGGTAGSAGTPQGGAAGNSAGMGGTAASGNGGSSAGVGGSGAGGSSAGAGGDAGSAGAAGTPQGGSGGDAGAAGAGGSGNGGSGAGGSMAGAGGSPAGAGGSGNGGSGAGGSMAGAGGSGAGGSSAGVGGSGGSSGAGAGGSAAGSGGSAGSSGTTSSTFTCSGWTRNAAFDAANTDAFPFVGGVWGTGPNSIYVTAYDQGTSSAVMHWNGSSWTKTAMPGNPPSLQTVWGTSDSNVCVASWNSKASLNCFDGNSWTVDAGFTGSKGINGLWFDASGNGAIVGTNLTAQATAWKKIGAAWVKQTLPADVVADGSLASLWAFDANNIVAPGFIDTDHNGFADFAIALYFDGNSWAKLQVPAEAAQLFRAHGTSINDVYFSGVLKSGGGVVYHVTNNLTSWTGYYDPNMAEYIPVWSKYPGTFLATGYLKPAGQGTLRVTTCDINGAVTSGVDAKAYQPFGFWSDPGSDKVFFVSLGFGNTAGFYGGNCK